MIRYDYYSPKADPRQAPIMPRNSLPIVQPGAPLMPRAVASRLGVLLNEVAAVCRLRCDAVLQAHGLRPRQFLVLAVLRDEGGASQQALGQRLNMDRTSTMQATQALADAGLVTREDDPHDRRVYRVSLTARGAAVLDAAEQALVEVEAQLIAPLPPETRAEFVTQLHAILDAERLREPGPGPT